MQNLLILEDLAQRNKISMQMMKVPSNPILLEEAPPDGVEHYKCRLTKPGKKMDIYLSLDSSDGQPTLSDVLFLLALDASGCKMMSGYEAYDEKWRTMFGGSDGNLKEIDEFWSEFRGRCEQVQKFRKFLGEPVYAEILQHVDVR